MKKLTGILLVMTMVFGLTACGNASKKGSNVTETQAQSAEDTGRTQQTVRKGKCHYCETSGIVEYGF